MKKAEIGKGILKYIGNKTKQVILNPINALVDDQLTDVATTIGACVIRTIRGKLQRTITFTTGLTYSDIWLEEAITGIIYENNDILSKPMIELKNVPGSDEGTSLHYALGDGTHNLRYKKWPILLNIQTSNLRSDNSRFSPIRTYTIICYDLSKEFVKSFQTDLIKHRNSIMHITKNSPYLSVYTDYHEITGDTYWEKVSSISKRGFDTIYLPYKQKKLLVNTISSWYHSKKFYQEHGIPWNLTIMLYGPPGTGKALPNSSKIPTPYGWKTMGEVKVGDMLFNENGMPVFVIGVYPQGIKDIYEITLLDGRKARCTEDHLWTVYSSNNRSQYDTKPLKDIMNDYTWTCNNYTRYKYRIPVLRRSVDYQKKEVPIDPYVLGVFLVASKLEYSDLVISTHHLEVGNYIASKLDAEMVPFNRHESGRCFKRKSDGSIIKTNEFLKDLPELQELKKDQLYIPEIYLINDTETRFQLARGIVDGKTFIANQTKSNYISFTVSTKSERFRDTAAELFRSLGMSISYQKDGRTPKGSKWFRIIASSSDKKKLIWKKENKYLKEAKDDEFKYDRVSIVDIQKVGQEECTCIKVDSPTELFLCEQFIPTHNTSISRAIASKYNRNIYEVTGGKHGKYIPNAITSSDQLIVSPLFSISDMDKYPMLISEPNIDMDKEGSKDESITWKQTFASMINALDGMMSGEDRITVITTNHIEKFSDAFMRAGRIDLKMEIGYITPEVFRQYVKDLYEIDLPKDIKLKRDDLTIAELQQDIIFYKMKPEEFVKKYSY